MRTEMLFDLYDRFGWPLARQFIRLSPRCRRCILSIKHGPLEDGLCRACREYVASHDIGDQGQASAEAVAAFETRMRERSKGAFDSLLMLSGGKDSAYMLQRLRTDFPEHRTLCLMVDNGFSSPSAIEGARFIARKTETDLLMASSCIPEFRKVLRKAFLELNGRGGYGVIDFADGELIFEIGRRIATSFSIPFVIGGLSWSQVRLIIGKEDSGDPGCFEHSISGSPPTVFPLAIWRPSEQHVRSEVQRLGLLPRGTDSPVRSNSGLILAMSVLDIKNLGYSSFEPEFAQMIREGKADRRTWLHLFELLEFATRRGFLTADLIKVLDRLGLQLQEVCKT